MELLIGADFSGFERDVLEDATDGLAVDMFVEVDIGSDPMGLFGAVCGYLMDDGCLFAGLVYNAGVVGDIVISLQVKF